MIAAWSTPTCVEAKVTGSAGEHPAARLPTADNADPGTENQFYAGKGAVKLAFYILYVYIHIHI